MFLFVAAVFLNNVVLNILSFFSILFVLICFIVIAYIKECFVAIVQPGTSCKIQEC